MINKESNQQTFQQRVAQFVSEKGLPTDQIILQDYDVQWLFNISRRTSLNIEN